MPRRRVRVPTSRGARYGNIDEAGWAMPPRNEIEDIVADILANCRVERVGIDSNSADDIAEVAYERSRIQVFGVKLSVGSSSNSTSDPELAKIVTDRQPGLEALAEKARILERSRRCHRTRPAEQALVARRHPGHFAATAPASGADGEVAVAHRLRRPRGRVPGTSTSW